MVRAPEQRSSSDISHLQRRCVVGLWDARHMSQQPSNGDEHKVELSETFEKSAEVVDFDPSEHFRMPQMMGLTVDANTAADAEPDSEGD